MPLELLLEHISSWILRYCSNFSVIICNEKGTPESPSPQHCCPSRMADEMQLCALHKPQAMSQLAEGVQTSCCHSNEGWLWRASGQRLPNLSCRHQHPQCPWPVWTESSLPDSNSARRWHILCTDPPGWQSGHHWGSPAHTSGSLLSDPSRCLPWCSPLLHQLHSLQTTEASETEASEAEA